MTLWLSNNRIGISPNTRGVWLAVAIFCVLPLIVAGGQQPRSVRGIVKDDQGHALARAIVQIQDRTTLQIRSYITGDDGSFHFGDLFPDLTYHLRAKYSGISSRSKTLSKFDSKSIAVIDLTIRLSR